MKTKKQKGFTLVELVIVIAVIAILAAVLIPTFSNLIKKANLSADEQAVKQMNTALAIYTAENGKPETAAEVKAGLSENDINTDTMTPVTKGYAFYWDKENNKIVLVGEGKGTAENTWSLLTSNGYGKAPEQAVTDATTLNAAINKSTNAEPVLIELTSDLTITEEIVIANEKSVIMDLNGKTINSQNVECAFTINGGSITLENGDINVSHRLFYNVEGNLSLSDLNVKSTGAEIKENSEGGLDDQNCGWSLIKFDGFSDTSIVRCNIETNDFFVLGCNAASTTSYGSRISIIDSTIKATGHFKNTNGAAIFIPILSDVTIDGSIIEGYNYAAYFKGCNAKITNSSFKNNDNAEDTTPGSGPSGKAADIYFACGGQNQNYFSVGNYACENVTVDDVVIYEPNGGKVTLTGIDSSKITNETN